MQPTDKTIQQVKAMADDSLWTFLLHLPETQEAQIFYALILSGTLGMIANYAVKWAKDELNGTLWNYLFRENYKRTALSFFTYVGATVAAVSANIFTTDAGAFVGWATVLWFGVSNGFAVDAIANKGSRPKWNDEQRAAKIPDPISIPPKG